MGNNRRKQLKTAILYIFLSGTICTRVTGQDSLYRNLLTEAIASFSDTAAFFYCDSSAQFFGKFSRFAKKGKVTGFIDLRNGVQSSTRFSRKELKEVDRKSKQNVNRIWPDRFINNAMRMPKDSFWLSLTHNKAIRIGGHTRYIYYYIFSDPIFVRNHTVAIFSMAQMIGPSAGNAFIWIYRKRNEIWKRELVMNIGAW